MIRNAQGKKNFPRIYYHYSTSIGLTLSMYLCMLVAIEYVNLLIKLSGNVILLQRRPYPGMDTWERFFQVGN